MSNREAEALAHCSHGAAIRHEVAGHSVERCPHCGAMRIADSEWAFPHLVKQFVEAWQKSPGHERRVFAEPETPCSFCNKKKGEPISDFLPEPLVRYVVQGPSVTICNACIFLCDDILREQGIEREKAEHVEDGHQPDECPTGACGRDLA